jgi:hypothetical protein
MMRRGALRRWLRWGGIAVALNLVALWAVSAFASIYYVFPGGRFECGIGEGVLGFAFGPPMPPPYPEGWLISLASSRKRLPFVWRPRLEKGVVAHFVDVPLWIPLVAVAGLTTWRWRADRLPGTHACKTCGYDRHGLADDAPCPECGAAARAK